MEKIELRLRDESIKLGQALKAAGVVENGGDAKYLIQNGKVSVNGKIELQRGKKLHEGDEVLLEAAEITIVSGSK